MLKKSPNDKKFIFSLPEPLHTRWKLASAKTGATMNDFLMEALSAKVATHLGPEQMLLHFSNDVATYTKSK